MGGPSRWERLRAAQQDERNCCGCEGQDGAGGDQARVFGALGLAALEAGLGGFGARVLRVLVEGAVQQGGVGDALFFERFGLEREAQAGGVFERGVQALGAAQRGDGVGARFVQRPFGERDVAGCHVGALLEVGIVGEQLVEAVFHRGQIALGARGLAVFEELADLSEAQPIELGEQLAGGALPGPVARWLLADDVFVGVAQLPARDLLLLVTFASSWVATGFDYDRSPIRSVCCVWD